MNWCVKAICISLVSYEPTVSVYNCAYASTRRTKVVNLCNFQLNGISTCRTQSVTISAGLASPGLVQPSNYQIQPHQHLYSGGGGYKLFTPSQPPHLGMTHCDHYDL